LCKLVVDKTELSLFLGARFTWFVPLVLRSESSLGLLLILVVVRLSPSMTLAIPVFADSTSSSSPYLFLPSLFINPKACIRFPSTFLGDALLNLSGMAIKRSLAALLPSFSRFLVISGVYLSSSLTAILALSLVYNPPIL